MRMIDIIKKKREGEALSKAEIDFFVNGYVDGTVPDYQASALLMAIYFQKMNAEETVYLTDAMLKSGDEIDLTSIEGIKVDKHSTGGVGDKTTLVLGPMVAACGLPMAKMSGRGLGHTGGTLDKLEAIKGLNIEMPKEQFIDNVNRVKMAVAGQTANITPADKKLYALRDVTCTVDNISLIASSIMSKKLASGSDAIVLDVKVGSGAFMKDLDHAFELASAMVEIGNNMGRETVGIISNMDEPLGFAIGNALEVKEAIDTLKGHGPKDLVELCMALGSRLLMLGKTAKTAEEAREMLEKVIADGSAFDKFCEFVEAQGGDVEYVKNTDLLAKAGIIKEYKSKKAGYITQMEAEEFGKCALVLGAGRETKDSVIDMSAGIVLNKKVTDRVEIGDTIAYIHGNKEDKIDEVLNRLDEIITIEAENRKDYRLVYGVVDKDGVKKLS